MRIGDADGRIEAAEVVVAIERIRTSPRIDIVGVLYVAAVKATGERQMPGLAQRGGVGGVGAPGACA